MRMLGIDIGTTTIKGAVLDLDSNKVGAPHTVPFPKAILTEFLGRHETPMNALLEAVGNVLDRLSAEAPEAAHLVLCGQMHGVTLIDGQGRALTPFISWKDRRALEPHPSGIGSYLDVFGGRLTDDERAALGNELRPGVGAMTLAHLQDQSKLSGPAIPTTVCDAVMAAWTGTAPVLTPSFAASLGVYDLSTHDWAHEVIEKWGLSCFTWPQVTNEPCPVYELSWKGRSLTVFSTLGDHQAALLGTNLHRDELSINISTGSQIAALSRDFQPGPYQTRPYFDGFYLNTFTHLPAGRALSLLITLLTEIPAASGAIEDPWDYVHRATAKVPATSLSIDLSFFKCLTGTEGSLQSLTEETLTVGHLFRAAFASMAANYHSYAHQLDLNRPWKTIALSGGLAQRSPALREEIEHVFQRLIRVSTESEETLRGLLEWGAQCLRKAGATDVGARGVAPTSSESSRRK